MISKPVASACCIFLSLALFVHCDQTKKYAADNSTVDSIVITYISPMIETFNAITVDEFRSLSKTEHMVNKLVLKDKGSINRLVRRKDCIDTIKKVSYIDTRMMTVFYRSNHIDTVFSSFPSADISIRNELFSDTSFMNALVGIIKMNDTIFPMTRIEVNDDGVIMK